MGTEDQSVLQLKVLEATSESIFATDNEGKIIFVNSAICASWGYTKEELLQMRIDDLIIPELKTVITSHRRTLRETGHVEFETAHLRKDGSIMLLELRSQAITWDGQSIIVISAHDISKRKDDERELSFRAYLLDSAIDAIIVSDENSDVVYVNEAACKMHGYTKEEMQKMNLSDIVSGFSNEVRKHEDDSVLKKTGGIVLEAVHMRKDKSTISVEVHNSQITVNDKKLRLGFIRDITERKRAQEEMRQTNEKLTTLINKFETQNQINKVVSELRDLLEVCSNIKETGPIISSAVQKIFPGVPCALLLMSESRSDLESVARWGGFTEDVDENVFSPGDCWGLRRGRIHVVESANGGPVCAHVKQVPEGGYMCLPLIAKGNVTGLPQHMISK
jgi:PAS domain S-box-containing protein